MTWKEVTSMIMELTGASTNVKANYLLRKNYFQTLKKVGNC
jgi:hypothetical protein